MSRALIALLLLLAIAARAAAPQSQPSTEQSQPPVKAKPITAEEVQRLIEARREQMKLEAEQADAAADAATAVEPVSTYLDDSLRVGQLIVGGQPEDVDITALKAAGASRVINLRTPEEMQDLGFDESAALAAAGLSYRQLPLGGAEFPYSPALLEAFAAEMAAADGKLVLHCASGGRAGLVYAAWLVKYQGKTPEQAMRTLESLGGWPLPMEKLLGRRLTVDFAEPGS